MRWWITLPRNGGPATCYDCGCETRGKTPIYFRAAKNQDDRMVLCQACGEEQNIAAEPSKKFRAWHEANRQNTLA